MRISLLLALLLTLAPGVSRGEAKPFQRALVIAGGGISPGVSLGMIAGARAAGYKPDLIFTTCGASLGAAILNAFDEPKDALAFASSREFHGILWRLVNIDSRLPFSLRNKFELAISRPRSLPELFRDNILFVPEDITGILPREKFPAKAGSPKFIILGARAGFGPGEHGKELGERPLFKEVFFTDPKTASYLKGRKSTVKKFFPGSRLSAHTETFTGISMAQAARASISDPFYLNPARIGGDYYFGGAIDLFPIETAQDLAGEVLINYPAGLYTSYENLAISSTFGFRQSDRTQLAAKTETVKWIDSSGTTALGMDPTLEGIFFVNNVPASFEDFRNLILDQYRFGFERAQEAVRMQRRHQNVRSHLRFTATGEL